MQRLRLFGLILFITTIFLSLAAWATQTVEIRLFDMRQSQEVDESNGNEQPTFIAVPIVLPLALAGGLGLFLWFGSAPREPVVNRRRRRRKR
jgi:hypothetical protein